MPCTTERQESFKWDLTALYHSQAEWEKALAAIDELSQRIAAKKDSMTASSGNLAEILNWMDELGIMMEWAASYARMSFDADMTNAQNKENFEKMDNLYAKVSDRLAFYEPRLLTIEQETFQKYREENPALEKYSFMFEKLFKLKEHVLSTDKEEILARMDALGGAFKKIYDDITVNDLTFPEIEDSDGKKIKADETNYRKILNSYDRGLRERYFKALLGTYGTHINSLTSVISGTIKHRSYEAKTRGYRSSREMALQQNHIPEKVYDTLVETVRSNTHLLQRYLELRKRVLKIEDIHFYDLFVPLVPGINRIYSFEEGKDLVTTALGVLGKDYTDVLNRAFSERWIDVFPKKGKTPGAYANGIYGLHPYSLLNFTGTLDDIFTMAHELGHVMHSYYSNKTQPYVDAGYVIFTAEVASTVNEYILYRHLLEHASSDQEKAYLLSLHLDSIRSTLFRQTFFADFEMQVHRMVENDIPLIPESMCSLYAQLYEDYYGEIFTIDKALTYEWARIPHFYNFFYVYQYATGISAAISLAKGILNEKKVPVSPALARYLDFLSRGGSDYPLNLLAKAGVDMASSDPIIAALEDFSSTLNELATLV